MEIFLLAILIGLLPGYIAQKKDTTFSLTGSVELYCSSLPCRG